jgi:ferredoxin
MLRKALKRVGGRLAAGFAVQMPNSHIVGGNPEDVEEQEKMFQQWKSKLDGLIEQINARKEGVFEKFFDARRSELKMVNFYLSFEVIGRTISMKYSSNDEWFYTNTNCSACGTCVNICPVENIEMLEGKPSWRRMHRCEQCFACLQWCPKGAIQCVIYPPHRVRGDESAKRTENRKRYHHPEIKLADLTRRRQANVG